MKSFLTIISVLITQLLVAQQTIRGSVKDIDTKQPIIGAVIVTDNEGGILSTMTDVNGDFRIPNAPLGRTKIAISYLGYDQKTIPNVIVFAAKEVVLNIELTESFEKIETVEIKIEKKGEVENEMATNSARSFTVEETKRYAGSFSDPARLVSSFAGVTPNANDRNDIVVRGNSSRGILWRLEGIEIPNPNHFYEEGMTGGPISALNSAMLANSEFYSGAFAPEYGNAFSGVFDMKLRSGNNEKRETSINIGVLGVDATAEGPLFGKGEGSYLVNYRYSTLSLLDGLGIIDYNGVPRYQDAAFKLKLPTKNKSTTTIFGFGGYSAIHIERFSDSLNYKNFDTQFSSNTGIIGVKNMVLLDDKTVLNSSFSISSSGNYDDIKNRDSLQDYLKNSYKDEIQITTVRAIATLNHKLNKYHKFQAGAIASHYLFNMTARAYIEEYGNLYTILNNNAQSRLIQGFGTWKYQVNKKLNLVSGLHGSYFLLNNQYSIEPRFGMKYKITPKQTLSLGAGVHSKLESFSTYFAVDTNQNEINLNLDFPTAYHYVLGYQSNFKKNLMLKAEVYYQDLRNIAVSSDSSSTFSLLNDLGGNVMDEGLVNSGKGYNYGLELTLEKYYSNNYFYLLTTSIYESKYAALDGVWRNTRFNGNYVVNYMVGKEFNLGKKEKNRILGTTVKFLLIGGGYYTGVDLNKSIEEDETVRLNEPLNEKGQDIFKLDLAIYYRKDNKKVTHEFKIDVQNATNNQAKTNPYFDSNLKTIDYERQMSLFPVLGYTVSF